MHISPLKKGIRMEKIGVIGCGAWGTAVAKILTDNHHSVLLWCHSQPLAAEINETHRISVLPEVNLPAPLIATSDLEKVLSESDYLVFAVASNYIDILDTIKTYYKPATPILVLTKGLLDGKDTLFVSEYIKRKLGKDASIAILSGPNLALEIAQGLPAASVIASEDEHLVHTFQVLLSNSYFRVYRSLDMIGVQLGGILKNVIAIAAGALDGLALGDNAKSALMARGLQEMIRFGKAFGAKPETFFGLSGLGDLITTCSSPKSRNWQAGYQIAKTRTVPDFSQTTVQIAEGVKSARIVYQIAQERHIDMPITQEIYRVIYTGKPILEAVQNLMTRDLKAEVLG